MAVTKSELRFQAGAKNGPLAANFIMVFLAVIALPLSAQVYKGELDETKRYLLHSDNQKQAYDYTLATSTPEAVLYVQAKGGDGGTGCGNTTGGSGATAEAAFKIGKMPGQIPPGSTIRFIVGEKGQDNIGSGFDANNSAGGGGTGVLFKAPDSNEWQILLVAGGGGGCYEDNNDVDRDNGRSGTSSEAGSNGNVVDHTPSNANKTSDDSDNGFGGKSVAATGGGGGAYSDGTAGAHSYGGKKGMSNGGGTGTANKDYSYVAGGWGFGGGGCAAGGNGGSGGGGYSGGGAGCSSDWTGLYFGGGGGGGSFINQTYTFKDKYEITEHDITWSPSDGYVEYQLYDLDARINDISLTAMSKAQPASVQLDVSGSGALAYSLSMNSMKMPVKNPDQPIPLRLPGTYQVTVQETNVPYKLNKASATIEVQPNYIIAIDDAISSTAATNGNNGQLQLKAYSPSDLVFTLSKIKFDPAITNFQTTSVQLASNSTGIFSGLPAGMYTIRVAFADPGITFQEDYSVVIVQE